MGIFTPLHELRNWGDFVLLERKVHYCVKSKFKVSQSSELKPGTKHHQERGCMLSCLSPRAAASLSLCSRPLSTRLQGQGTKPPARSPHSHHPLLTPGNSLLRHPAPVQLI